MKTRASWKKWLGWIGLLLCIQCSTYLFLGPFLLRWQLLEGGFGSIAQGRDTAFVRDYYTTDCRTGDPNIYCSHHLDSKPDFIRKKLRTSNLIFAANQGTIWSDQPEKTHALVYNTWYLHGPWWTLFDFFRSVQTEEIIVDGKSYYHLETTRYWFLFFWLKRFEHLEAWHY